MIYIDSECKCHTTNPDGSLREVETNFFDGKCDAFVEGYRFIPAGESWTRPDGVVFTGEMIAPWKNWLELDSAQREYEREQYAAMAAELADTKSALEILGVNV